MEVHNELGHGFLEIVYKDALELLFRQEGIYYKREKPYEVYFRGVLLPHKFYSDFVVEDKIILKVKCVSSLTDDHIVDLQQKTGQHIKLLFFDLSFQTVQESYTSNKNASFFCCTKFL